MANVSPSSTACVWLTKTLVITPDTGAVISISIFIASKIMICWSFSTLSPSFTSIFQTAPLTAAGTSVPPFVEAIGVDTGVWVATGAATGVTWISALPSEILTLNFCPSTTTVYFPN